MKIAIGNRLEKYSTEIIETAIKNIRSSNFHLGENANGNFYATLDFICRNDETIEKWYNSKPSNKQILHTDNKRQYNVIELEKMLLGR